MSTRTTIERVFELTVASGTTGDKTDFFLPEGKILGCMVYKGDLNNPGYVRASIKNTGGEFISELQHIDNYRSREAAYLDGIKPLQIEGGKTYIFEVLATEQFTGDFMSELIFVYENEKQSC